MLNYSNLGVTSALSKAYLELPEDEVQQLLINCIEPGCSLWVSHNQEFEFSGQPFLDGSPKP